MKKAYTSPALIVRGTIEEITQGSKCGFADMLWGDGGGWGIICRQPSDGS